MFLNTSVNRKNIIHKLTGTLEQILCAFARMDGVNKQSPYLAENSAVLVL
jgi:hypothetical protein